MCELCQMYKKLHTADGTQLWIEYTKNAVQELVPVLVMDSTAHGGGRNELWMKYCPLCGADLKNTEGSAGKEQKTTRNKKRRAKKWECRAITEKTLL